ncbi:aldehyde dehydrogenase family protein [Bacteroidales bacterium AH-315-I05]|nr:aldehyde dehydrogenase family protein [Bacteroidales bacterium AH-315-I05]
MNIINPASETIIATIEEDNSSSIQQKYELVRKGQPEWAKTSLSERIACIQRFHDLLKKNIDELGRMLTSEMGKPLNQATGEIAGARKRIQFFIENSEKWLADESVYHEKTLEEKIVWEPLGVVANISAWNYPYLVGVNVFVPALIAGNGVLYKPSEYTPLTGLEIEKMLYKSGIPENVFQTIVGAKDAGQALLELPFNGYFFTGSYKTGKHIYETVAHKMVTCQLELGGKDPLYVTDDNQNIANAAIAAAEGAFYNNGQSCCAVERIYVHEKVYQEFVDEFVKEVKTYKVGNPMEDGVFIGPLSRKEQPDFLQQQVDDALEKGTKVLLGASSFQLKNNVGELKGYYYKPTVLVNVNHQMKVMKEESFGPVIGIQKVRNDEEAIALMKDTEYGLTSAVYSDSKERAEKIMREMNSGAVYWNCCDRVSANLPWSGRKNSGIGATLSYIGIRAFVRPKAYHLRSA